MRSYVFAAVAVAALLLSGCTAPESESLPGRSGLVRHIVAEIDEDRARRAQMAGSIEAAMAEFSTVWYEYTHTGDDAVAATLVFHYTLASGLPASAPLSTFSTRTTLREGDVVKIQPTPAAGVFGPIKVVDATGQVLSARSGAVANWFTVGNYPLPFAVSEAGTTTWTLDGDGSLKAQVTGMELPETRTNECYRYDCYETTQPGGYVHHARLDLDLDVKGTMSIDASPNALNLDASTALGYDVDLVLDVDTPDMEIDASVVGEVDIDATGTFDLAFKDNREIESLSYSSHVVVDGDVDVQGLPGAEPPQQHPWSEETVPRKTHPLALGTQAPEPAIVRFLAAAYALDLAEGDEIRLEATSPADDDGNVVKMRYVSQVLGVEERRVAGQDRPAFKVSDTFSLQILQGGEFVKEDKVDLTYWVDLATYLPVYAQSKIQQTLDGVALRDRIGLLRSMDVDLPSIPDGASLVFTTEATQRMTAYGGDFNTAAIVGVGAARLVPLLGAVSLMGYNY